MRQQFYYVFVLFIFFCEVSVRSESFKNSQLLVDYKDDITESDIQCVSEILNEYFPCNGMITLVYSHDNANDFIKSINDLNCYTTVVRSFKFQDWLVRTNIYIIIVQDVNQFSENMYELSRDTLWNPRAHFIFHFQNLSENEIYDIFKKFLIFNIYKVILLNHLFNNKIQLRTYDPFNNNNCGKHFDKIVNLGFCNNVRNNSNLYPSNSKKFSLRNCSFTVAANEDIPNIILESSNYTVYGKYINGVEQYLLDTIAAREAITLKYKFATADDMFGIVLPNRTTTGILNNLQNGDVTMAVGGFVLMKNRMEIFDYIWGYNYAEFILLTPSNDETVWKKVYREFGFQTWVLILLAYIAMSVYTFISRELWSTRNPDYLILNMRLWAYFYGQADGGLFRDTKPKAIVLLWSMFTFFIFSFYSTAYYSLITGHVKEERTFKTDAISTIPYRSCVSDSVRIFYQYAYNIELPTNNDPECRYSENAMNTVALRKDSFTIQMDYSYKLREFMYIDEDGDHLMETWNFSHDSVIAIYLKRGFPRKRIFQRYAMYMYESGLLQKHLNTIYTKNQISMLRLQKKFIAVRLMDFRIHFAILFIGYVLSFLCFIVEKFKR